MLGYSAKIKGKVEGDTSPMTMAHTFQQFFTPSKYSQVMIDALEIKPPKKIIDLTSGLFFMTNGLL